MSQVNINDLEVVRLDLGGTKPIYKYQGQYFTGVATKYYDSGSVLSEDEYIDGYQEGWIRYYYPNGQLKVEYKEYNNLLINNTYKRYDENGNLVHSM